MSVEPLSGPGGDPAMDRLSVMHREQLSALIDGELPADQARFLIRRLEHDEALAGCHERWQLIGDALRGELGAIAPLDFAGRVADAVVHEAAVVPAVRRPHSRYWVGGGALAAALAVMALVPLLRTSNGTAVETPMSVVADAEVPAISSVGMDAGALPAVGLATPSQAVAAVPASPVEAVAAPVKQRRALAPAALPPAQSAVLMAAARSAPVATDEPASPFSLPDARPEARPWPRSSLSGDARFTVRLAPGAASNPFAPEVAAEHLQAADPAGH